MSSVHGLKLPIYWVAIRGCHQTLRQNIKKYLVAGEIALGEIALCEISSWCWLIFFFGEIELSEI
jgi:hypothetical protein